MTRTQWTGTVPNTSGEGDLWLDMEGGRWSSFRVELEQADDKESLEALHEGAGQKVFQVSEVSPSQRDVHKRTPTLSTRGTNGASSTGMGNTLLLRVPTSSFFHPSPTHGIHKILWQRTCARARGTRQDAARPLAAVLFYECIGRS